MATGDIYQIDMVFFESGQGKTFHSGFQVRQGGAAYDFNEIGDMCKSFWNDTLNTFTLKSNYPTELALQEVTSRRIDPLEDVIVRYNTGLPIAGTSASDRMPGEVAVLLSHRTANIGRSRRGRTYLPAPVEAVNDEPGWWTSAFITGVVENWADTIGTLGAIGTLLPQVVWSQKLKDDGVLTPWSAVTQTRGDRRARSQRRRNIRTPQYVLPT